MLLGQTAFLHFICGRKVVLSIVCYLVAKHGQLLFSLSVHEQSFLLQLFVFTVAATPISAAF